MFAKKFYKEELPYHATLLLEKRCVDSRDISRIQNSKNRVRIIYKSINTGLAKKNCTLGQSVITYFWNEITF